MIQFFGYDLNTKKESISFVEADFFKVPNQMPNRASQVERSRNLDIHKLQKLFNPN